MRLSLDTFRNNTTLQIHIVGAAAVEGAAVARFLAKLGAVNVILHDFCEQKDFAKRFLTFHNGVKNRAQLWQIMKNLPYAYRFADEYLVGIEDADIIFLNQAWYKYDFNFPKLGHLVEEGKVAISSMMDLYLQLFPGKIICVTGTHGKTTVTRLLGHVLSQSGLRAYVSGNDRHSEQILDHLAEPNAFTDQDWLILEISNRQLKQRYTRGPDIAVITNIYDNHLDEHLDLNEYRATKEKIADNQPAGSVLIVGDNDPILVDWARQHHAFVVDQSVLESIQTQYVLPGTLRGAHNVSNVAFVAHVASLLGISPLSIQASLNNFPGVEKRMQKIYQDKDLIVINDLAATTPQATWAAVQAYADHPLVVIMGGEDKNIPMASWQQLRQSLVSAKVILLPGSVRDKLNLEQATLCNDWLAVMKELKSIKRSLSSNQLNQKETIILLSPAGEGFYTYFLQGVHLTKDIETTFAHQSLSK